MCWLPAEQCNKHAQLARDFAQALREIRTHVATRSEALNNLKSYFDVSDAVGKAPEMDSPSVEAIQYHARKSKIDMLGDWEKEAYDGSPT